MERVIYHCGLLFGRRVGVLQKRMSTSYVAKYLRFFENYDVSTRVRCVCGGGQFFRFCADVFYGQALILHFSTYRNQNLFENNLF